MNARSFVPFVALGAGGALFSLSAVSISSTSLFDAPAVSFAIAAAIAALLPRQTRWLEACGVAGLVLLTVSQAVLTSINLGALGIALLLGCLAGLAKTPAMQATLGGGMLGGLVLNHVSLTTVMPQLYSDYSTPSLEFVPLVLTVVTGVALLWTQWPSGQQADAQVLAVAVGLPVLVLVEAQVSDPSLFAVLQAATIIAAAFLLPGRSGIAILAGGAIALSPVAAAWPTAIGALIVIGLIIGGLVLGLKRPHVPAGIAVIALSVAPVDIGPVEGVLLFAAVLAVAYSWSSSVPVPGAVLAIAIAMPFFPTVQQRVNFGWTAYTPLTSDGRLLNGNWIPFLILTAFAVCAYFLSRRSARS